MKLKQKVKTGMLMWPKQNLNRSSDYHFLSFLCLCFSFSLATVKDSRSLLRLSLLYKCQCVCVDVPPPPVMGLTDCAFLRVIDLRCGVSHKHFREEERRGERLSAPPSLRRFNIPNARGGAQLPLSSTAKTPHALNPHRKAPHYACNLPRTGATKSCRLLHDEVM